MRVIIIGAVVLTLLGSGLAFVTLRSPAGFPAAQATAAPTPDLATTAAPTAIPLRAPGTPVIVSGVVTPAASYRVRFPLPGLVSAVLVEQGQLVKAGDPLATLDTRDAELLIERLQLKVKQAELQLDLMRGSPSDEEVQISQARIASAEARLRQAQAEYNAHDIEAANQSVAASQQSVAEIADGPRPQDLAIAQAAVNQAQVQVQDARDSLSAAKTDYQLQLTLRANELRNRQDTYSRIYWRNRDIERNGTLTQSQIDEEAEALRSVSDGEVDLERARVDYEEALKAEQAGIDHAQTILADAQARLDKVLAGPEQSERTAAAAVAARDAATRERLIGEARAADIDNARAQLTEAQAALAFLKSKPTDTDFAQAELDLQIAQLELKEAQLSMEIATIRAPIDGTVAIMRMSPGDSTESAYIQVADLSTWAIETATINEIDIVRLREGSLATMTFVALPGVELTGTVQQVGIVVQENGEVAYRAIILPDTQDDRLRWNMGVSVAIASE